MPCFAAFTRAAIAADDEPVFGTRHADIEQAAIFFLRPRFQLLDLSGREAGLVSGIRLPEIAFHRRTIIRKVKRNELWRTTASPDRASRINKKHHRPFQPLGGMDSHDAHFIAPLIEFTLDFRRCRFQRFKEGLQAGQTGTLGGKRIILEFVDDIARLRPQPRQ